MVVMDGHSFVHVKGGYKGNDRCLFLSDLGRIAGASVNGVNFPCRGGRRDLQLLYVWEVDTHLSYRTDQLVTRLVGCSSNVDRSARTTATAMINTHMFVS